MKIQLVRNATMRIEYAGQTILTDPCLAAVGTLPAYADRHPNPIVRRQMPTLTSTTKTSSGFVALY